MARKRHPKKEVEDALQYAEANGWTVSDTASGHRWGVASALATARRRPHLVNAPSPADHAPQIRRNVDRCPHVGEAP